LQQTAAAAERVFEFLDEAEEPAETNEALTVIRNNSPQGGENSVISKGGSFLKSLLRLQSAKSRSFRNFSAKIDPGQKNCHRSGTRERGNHDSQAADAVYDAADGAITIDGHDIRAFRRNELRSVFGMVLQDTWLFGGSIADNIRYGKLNASLDEVKRRRRARRRSTLCQTLPDGYDLVLNEEATNISQGQKQLLTIARVILADPKILILDEATSSVDTRTEILIQKAMDNLMKGRTSFIIAHRLSTIRNADLILVMDEGDSWSRAHTRSCSPEKAIIQGSITVSLKRPNEPCPIIQNLRRSLAGGGAILSKNPLCWAFSTKGYIALRRDAK
jgi:ATP-binding cassette subfamily B protein